MKELRELVRHPAGWLKGDAPQRDIVLSSRVRLARNVEGRRFTHSNSDDRLIGLRDELAVVLNRQEPLRDAARWDMESLDEIERRFLLERHLVSADLLRPMVGRGVLVAPGEATSVMLNEEDHLRIQTYAAGLDPERALARALDLATGLQDELPFSWSSRLGWLTACPTNVGTGLRASILVHLPALGLTKDTERVLNSLRRLNFTVRGFYGEGSGAMGGLFQISNSVTLGPTESEIVEELLLHTGKVIACERRAREAILDRGRLALEDRAWRAFGIFRHCRSITTGEAFELLSDLRLGVSLGLLPGLDEEKLNMLLMGVQAAHLQVVEGSAMAPRDRDEARARYLRGELEAAADGDKGTSG